MKKRIVAGAIAVLAAAGVALGLLASASSAGTPSLPALTTVPAAYTVPGTQLSITPQPTSALAAQTSVMMAAVQKFCGVTGTNGESCFSATPDGVQYVLFSDHHDPANLITNEPAYLLQWSLTGKACFLGLGGPATGTSKVDPNTLGEYAVCQLTVVVDAGNLMPGQQIDSWEN